MKVYLKIIITIIIIAIIIFVYLIKDNKLENIDEEKLSTTTTKDFSTDVVINDSTDFYEISAVYPKDSRDKNFIIEKTVTNIIKSKQEEWKKGGDLYKAEQDLRSNFPDLSSIKYELDIQYYKYESKNKNTISYVIRSYEFTGGAHGNTGLFTYTFDEKGLINVDKFLNLNDENAIALTDLIKNKLIVSLKDLYNSEMLNLGLSDIYKNFDNFVILDEGIKFIFGQYQVAPYAAGQPEVVLSWEELETFIKK